MDGKKMENTLSEFSCHQFSCLEFPVEQRRQVTRSVALQTDVGKPGHRTSATVRHSSTPKTGATCKWNLCQLDFEVFVPTAGGLTIPSFLFRISKRLANL